MIVLAMATGISVTAWLAEDDQTIRTALELLEQQGSEQTEQAWPE